MAFNLPNMEPAGGISRRGWKGECQMYKVIIDKVEGHGANFEGEGSTIEVALKRARKEMETEYGRGVAGFNYSTYKINVDKMTGETSVEYLQSFGA